MALIVAGTCAAASVIRSVSVTGNRALSSSEIRRGSLLQPGLAVSDSLVSLEVARIDSLYFSMGILAVRIAADTVRSGDGVVLRLAVEEAEPARVGRVSVSGSTLIDDEEARASIRPAEGDIFDPFRLRRSLAALLERYNEAGYPYAQVWLTGFSYREDANEVDLAVSISEADRAVLSRIVFEGLGKTDSTVVRRTSRLRPGALFRSGNIRRARAYLAASGYFESVGEARLERRGGGEIDVFIPVKEATAASSFQGAVGFSKKPDGSYVASGAAGLALRNIAGKGRIASLDWLNDGQRYSRIGLRFREPFLLSTPLGLDVELSQVVQDSIYVFSAGGLSIALPVGPATTLHAGVAGDRNVPEGGELLRSVRRRFRIGLSRREGESVGLSVQLEGAYRTSYLRGDRTSREGQLLYDAEASASIATLGAQSVFLRLASQGVFSRGEVPLAETYPLGGATTLRGYREAQFRGEKIAWASIEYRFGEGGPFFIFDDIGAYRFREEGWTLKNGAGFGLRAESPVGVVSLSFGVGERLSLDETRMHISLAERF